MSFRTVSAISAGLALAAGAAQGQGLATRLAGQGVPMREIVPDVAYVLVDPEGNRVELYTPPKS